LAVIAASRGAFATVELASEDEVESAIAAYLSNKACSSAWLRVDYEKFSEVSTGPQVPHIWMTDLLYCKHEAFKRRKVESTIVGLADLSVDLLHSRTGF
jgi:hypothetical protein